MTLTVATAETALRERLDEATTSAWTATMLRRWLNEGIRDMARRTFALEDTDTVAVSANDGLYTVDADVLRINFAFFTPTADTHQNTMLMPRQFEGFLQGMRGDHGRTGDPVFFSTYGYSPTLQLQLWPVPYRAGSMVLHVARLPAALDITSGTGNVDAPEAWLEVALDYAQYMAEKKERMPEWKDTLQLYEAKCADMVANMETLNAQNEIIYDGAATVPAWLAEFD